MEETWFPSSGGQNRGGFRQGNSGRRGSRGRGYFHQSERKRHRPRSPSDQSYHRPRFDSFHPHDSFPPPFQEFPLGGDPYFCPQPHSSFGPHQEDSHQPNPFYGQSRRPHHREVDFSDEMPFLTADEMKMDKNQHQRFGYVKRGRGSGNSSRGASRGFARGNLTKTGNRSESYRGAKTNFNPRGRSHGYSFGQTQRGKPRGRSAYQMQPDQPAVHSLAKLTMPDPTLMSIAEKVKRFGLFLKTATPKANAIQTIQNALSASKLMLTAEYDSSVLLLYAGRPMFTGCLHIGGQFIVRAVGPTKKELKHDVYNQAFQILTTETVQAILSRVDRPEELKQTVLENLEKGVSDTTPPGSEFEAAVSPLITTLKTLLPALNSISVLEQARSMSHCPLKSSCTFEECDPGKKYFRSSYWLENTLIAIGHGRKKKEAKHNTYENAIKALTTRSFEELESGQNVEGSSSETEWLQMSTNLPVHSDSETKAPGDETSMEKSLSEKKFNLEEQLTKLVDQLKEYIFKLNNVHKIDCLAVKLSLSPVCVYKKLACIDDAAPEVSCDLYINDIFIASSESTSKKEAQLQAYQKAWEFLTTTPVESILSEQPRKPDFSSSDPTIIEVVHKGAGKYGDSNIERLGRYLIDVYENWKSVDEVIIMEHIDWILDRERHAFGILSQSATLSGLLMEWKIIKDESCSGLFKCSMFLQKEEVACGKDPTKNGARNKASVKALNKLYRTQPIIQVLRREETKSIYTWDEIKESAKAWRSPGEESLPLDDSGEQSSDHILNYCKHLLKQKLAEDTLEGVIFRSGMTPSEIRGIKQHASALKMKSDMHQSSGEAELIVSKKLTPDEILGCLQRNNKRSGRYLLLTDQERPSLTDNEKPAANSLPENCEDVLEVMEDSQQ